MHSSVGIASEYKGENRFSILGDLSDRDNKKVRSEYQQTAHDNLDLIWELSRFILNKKDVQEFRSDLYRLIAVLNDDPAGIRDPKKGEQTHMSTMNEANMIRVDEYMKLLMKENNGNIRNIHKKVQIFSKNIAQELNDSSINNNQLIKFAKEKLSLAGLDKKEELKSEQDNAPKKTFPKKTKTVKKNVGYFESINFKLSSNLGHEEKVTFTQVLISCLKDKNKKHLNEKEKLINQVVKHYFDGDKQKLFEVVEKGARQFPDNNLFIGVKASCLIKGIGTKKDYYKAYNSLKKMSRRTDNETIKNLLFVLIMYPEVRERITMKQCFEIAEAAGNTGNLLAIFACAHILYADNDFERGTRGKKKSIAYFLKALELGFYEAFENLKNMITHPIESSLFSKEQKNQLAVQFNKHYSSLSIKLIYEVPNLSNSGKIEEAYHTIRNIYNNPITYSICAPLFDNYQEIVGNLHHFVNNQKTIQEIYNPIEERFLLQCQKKTNKLKNIDNIKKLDELETTLVHESKKNNLNGTLEIFGEKYKDTKDKLFICLDFITIKQKLDKLYEDNDKYLHIKKAIDNLKDKLILEYMKTGKLKNINNEEDVDKLELSLLDKSEPEKLDKTWNIFKEKYNGTKEKYNLCLNFLCLKQKLDPNYKDTDQYEDIKKITGKLFKKIMEEKQKKKNKPDNNVDDAKADQIHNNKNKENNRS